VLLEDERTMLVFGGIHFASQRVFDDVYIFDTREYASYDG
jgi:hypothetical protein